MEHEPTKEWYPYKFNSITDKTLQKILNKAISSMVQNDSINNKFGGEI